MLTTIGVLPYIIIGKKDSACNDWQRASELGVYQGLNWAKQKGICH